MGWGYGSVAECLPVNSTLSTEKKNQRQQKTTFSHTEENVFKNMKPKCLQ